LVALCNGTLGTLHVDFAGIAKDLLWASSSEQEAELLESLDIDPAVWAGWKSSAEASIDPAGTQLALARVDTVTWNALVPKVRHFIATALVHLEEQGHAPQLDYAPISIEITKALEVQLAFILEGFRGHLAGVVPRHDESLYAEEALSVLLQGGKAPTIGTMAYLLQKPKEASSPLAIALHDYLKTLPGGEFMTSKAFAKKGLNRVIHKYRNGGVHDSPIAEDACRECVDTLVGSGEKAGYIARLVTG
jgi:hypothetical protein